MSRSGAFSADAPDKSPSNVRIHGGNLSPSLLHTHLNWVCSDIKGLKPSLSLCCAQLLLAMAVCPEEKGIADRSHEFPLRCCSSIPLLKPGADAATHSYCLDVLPVLLDEASIPVNLTCPYGSSQQGQGFYGISGVLEKDNISPESPSQLTFLSFLEVPYPSESQPCSDVHWNCSNHIDLQIESADKCQLCWVGVEMQDGCLETPKINDETVGSLMRSEAPLNSALSIKSSLQLGGKMMQILIDHSVTLLRCTSRDKCNNERGYDTTNNKWRRFKRSASFNSRRIVLFSSILS